MKGSRLVLQCEIDKRTSLFFNVVLVVSENEHMEGCFDEDEGARSQFVVASPGWDELRRFVSNIELAKFVPDKVEIRTAAIIQ